MPVKPLPRELIGRLKALYREEMAKSHDDPSRVYRVLGKMRNIDHR